MKLFSRNGNDISASFPDVAAALSDTTAGRSVTLDGELVALDSGGRPDFGLLQRRMHVARPSAALLRSTPVTYFVFDVLDIDGESVRTLPYTQRRELLEGLGVADGRRVQVPPNMTGIDGETLMGIAADNGIEGGRGEESGVGVPIGDPVAIVGQGSDPEHTRRRDLRMGSHWRARRWDTGGAATRSVRRGGRVGLHRPCGNGFHRSDAPRAAKHTHRAHPSGQCATRSGSTHRRSRSVLGDTGIGGDRGIPRTIGNGAFTASRIQRNPIRYHSPRCRDMKGCSLSSHSLVTLAGTRVRDKCV